MEEQVQKEDTQQCSNCLKDFPNDKIDLHEAYCCRNIRRCQLCTAMVDINNLDEHMSQEHTKQACPHCTHEYDPAELTKHEADCPRRPIICKFCENAFAFEEMKRHDQMCGARTKPCTICQKLVSFRDFEGHESRCAERRSHRNREQHNEVSQDNHYRPRVERERQNSSNNNHNNRSNSVKNAQGKAHFLPTKVKKDNIIPPEKIKYPIDPIPISIRMAMGKNHSGVRPPLQSKN